MKREISRFMIFSFIPGKWHNTQIILKDRDTFFLSFFLSFLRIPRNLSETSPGHKGNLSLAETFTAQRVQTRSTCIKRNPSEKKKIGSLLFHYRDCSLYNYTDGFPNIEFPYLMCVHYDKNHNNDTVYVKLCYHAEMRRKELTKKT